MYNMNAANILELQTWIVYQRVAVECANCLFMTDNAFKAKDIGLRAQKKILSRMATKNVAKVFIDGTTASLLDNVYRLVKVHTGSKKDAERLVKNIIKIVIKIAVLHRNGQLNADELKQAERFRSKFQTLQMAILSFYEVDYSFDLSYLQKSLADCRGLLRAVVVRHLTDKSLGRIDEVFETFSDSSLLETAFRQDSPYREIMDKIVLDLNKAMENGDI
ncbi:tumor necrosis factor alpha-induced protein 8-like protein isoform X1 [Anopheles darlingi]|uniref:tumor necrosis factor alpha-induced protein 8-like protein isoform X1 n=1 Tax=Anopheles darlingi TaxID=43151 RepID=UPI00210019EE|nr:tumor necrosis factor alpha-induced protein 8-like protein isoform X1 [Anopheles darlingi]XP_049530063.1 tumor necrosis factor alpha-induced protein 8-like protein isoform X1 [Anopheles darlingi]XP_049530064.1 tumor necrosis factor alpha-induced protein 8-like protein isoform X1 [Anopheles darlingi]